EIGDAEACEPGLRLAAATCRALIANLPARAGRRARERRDRGRMIVSLDLHQNVDGLARSLIEPGLRVGKEPRTGRALDDRRVVAISREDAARVASVRVPDHFKERLRLLAAVYDPARIEDLVAAMLGVR